METYSVRKFCNMVGVPYSSLRYYERIGLLKPRQNDNNNYREYTAHDAFCVNRFKRFRSLGFEVNESLELLNGSIDYISERVEEQEIKLEKEINLMNAKLEQLQKWKRNIEIIKMNGEYKVVTINDKFFLPASRGNDFNVSEYDDMVQWVELLPITCYSKRIKEEYIYSGEEIQQDYGLSIDLNKAYLLSVDALKKSEYLEGGKALTFYSRNFKHGDIKSGEINEALEYLKNNNLKFKGHIYLEGSGVVDDEGERGQIVYIPFI